MSKMHVTFKTKQRGGNRPLWCLGPGGTASDGGQALRNQAPAASIFT